MVKDKEEVLDKLVFFYENVEPMAPSRKFLSVVFEELKEGVPYFYEMECHKKIMGYLKYMIQYPEIWLVDILRITKELNDLYGGNILDRIQ